MIIAALVLALAALDAAFVAGCLWASRGPELPPPPQFRRVARPTCVVLTGPRTGTAVAADYVAQRADFAPADRDVLDSLVLLDALERGKW